jgi:serine/threonine protein kinase
MSYSAEEALPLGTEVRGRYRTLTTVGRGGVGTVYKVADVLYGNTYALKELANPSHSARKQFENEAQWLEGLNHNNIPKVREFFEWEGRVYLVMDFVDGENLEQMLARQGGRPLPEAQVIAWTLPICDALHYLHSQQPPILHRDVKPANIIVTPTGHPVLVDLGIAKEHLPGAGLTATFVKKAGTEGYAPPEQYIAAGKTGPWSDVYGMGATLYELLTGTVPPTAVERVALDSPMLRPRTLNASISAYADEAVTRALALRPADRFQSMLDLARALRGESRPSAPSLYSGASGTPSNAFAPVRPSGPMMPPLRQSAPSIGSGFSGPSGALSELGLRLIPAWWQRSGTTTTSAAEQGKEHQASRRRCRRRTGTGCNAHGQPRWLVVGGGDRSAGPAWCRRWRTCHRHAGGAATTRPVHATGDGRRLLRRAQGARLLPCLAVLLHQPQRPLVTGQLCQQAQGRRRSVRACHQRRQGERRARFVWESACHRHRTAGRQHGNPDDLHPRLDALRWQRLAHRQHQ